jgi:hypothetical protein
MRILSGKEQQLCKKLLDQKKKFSLIGDLLDQDHKGMVLRCDKKEKTVKVFLTNLDMSKGVAMFDPSENQKVIEELITTLNLIKLLEKEGYIIIYKSVESSDIFTLGSEIVKNENLFYHFPDTEFALLLLDNIFKQIIITDEFRRFCNAGFMARDEQRFQKQIRTATKALYISAGGIILNLIFNILSKFSGIIKEFLYILFH